MNAEQISTLILAQLDDYEQSLRDALSIILRDVELKRKIVKVCQEAMIAGEIQPGTTWNDDAAGAELAREIIHLMAGIKEG